MLTQTEEAINEILELPEDSPIASTLFKQYPMSGKLPQPSEIEYLLGQEGIDTTEMARAINELVRAFKLAKAYHVEHLRLRERRKMSCPQAILNYCAEDLKDLNQEVLIVVALSTRNNVIDKWIAKEVVFKGSLDQIGIHPREIFNFAIRNSAASIILLHNHPSGDPKPSSGDIQATCQIVEAGKLLEIPVLDHIVVGDGCYLSMREEALLPFKT